MTLYTGHGGSGTALSFTAGNIAGTRMETKYCELCGRMYLRPVNPDGWLGRDCDRCVRRADMRRAQEAREIAFARSLGDPRRMPQ
jgi:hypothetical protein